MSRRRFLVPIAAALVGILLFIYAISRVGWPNVVNSVSRVGWGFVPILALAGLRFLLRASAWRLCMPPQVRLSLGQSFMAFLSGDAVGNVTPLGLFASEPTKVFLVRHRLATREAAASLAVDVVVYTLSAVSMVAVGLGVLLATVPVSVGSPQVIAVTLLTLGIGGLAALRIAAGTWNAERGERPAWRARLAGLRQSVIAFLAAHPERLWRVFLFDLLFQAVAVAEVYLTLRLLLPEGPTLAESVVFSALDRAVVIAFKFIPFRLGVDEASSGGMAALLGWSPATGVALALIRKVRSVAWVGVGLLLIASHPSQGGPATDLPGSGRARPI